MSRNADYPLWPITAAILLALAIAAAGCTDYMHHRETISLHTGEAVRANIAIQTLDPWPPHAYETRIRHHGGRMRHAAERYNAGPDDNKKVGSQPIILAPVGAPAQN
jgi:hypothetical protein